MIFTFNKTINSELSDSIVSSETYSGLGVSNVGASTGQSLPSISVIPYVRVDSQANRRLFASNISLTGFDILGDEIGDPPPYAVSILIDTSLSLEQGSIFSNLGGLIRTIRNTYFTLPRTGEKNNLWSIEGIEAVPDELLTNLINTSMRQVSAEIFEDTDIVSLTLSQDTDRVTLPSDVFMIKEVLLFQADTSTVGTPLQAASSQENLIRGNPDDFIKEAPFRYMTWKQTQSGASFSSRVLIFDRLANTDYRIDVMYWKLPDDLVGTSDIPEIFKGYHEMIQDKTCEKIAKLIGDSRRKLEFSQSYADLLSTYITNQKAFTRSHLTMYADMNLSHVSRKAKRDHNNC